MIVQQILKSKGADGVVTVTPDTPVSQVAQVLSENRIGGVVVSTSGDTAEGILSERDIVRALSRRGPTCLEDRAEEMMTRDPVCCQRRDTADEVLRRMTDGRFRHMPVVEDGKLIGIVTIGDVVKARLNELSMERDALEGMIAGH
ncbi:CBS domain protein [Pseudooceanicola batsensis HTCC2597]|uniref:CBS domain protein n=1 Tax=Pseudooceanicola batsensis (strain ATCC BAA-863 / DSM 15984 / KCTC 12145 / HTCC2597) TaxID=252305 RepID=A3U2U5_PSEBH|nr:CBS domain-containing protein [Pseudooceanicola batsensis]EAQ01475.1 CBS domain protein [Pseudooceanicola batsensis HTCC2597]